jgi:arabinofuranan 3-O-arabinosyltransferase
MMVLAIPVGYLVRMGLAHGFRSYELPTLACGVVLVVVFIFSGIPVGFVMTLGIGALILRRAGTWWRRAPVSAAMAVPASA